MVELRSHDVLPFDDSRFQMLKLFQAALGISCFIHIRISGYFSALRYCVLVIERKANSTKLMFVFTI